MSLVEQMAAAKSANEYHQRLLRGDIPDSIKPFGISFFMLGVPFKELSEQYRVINVTEGLTKEQVELMNFGYAASIDEAIHRVIDRDYRVEDRMTIDVTVLDNDLEVIGRGWALNEVSVENLNRRGVLDAILEVDGRPVSSFGCDGVLISTPTGSTAYAFSAGGPVLWPELDAILVVPNNAHALFTKPLVVSPRSTVAVESNPDASPAMAVMDGFRPIPMPPGSRVEVVRGARPVRWVRLDESTFTDRLVTKLRLPVSGWRGPRNQQK